MNKERNDETGVGGREDMIGMKLKKSKKGHRNGKGGRKASNGEVEWSELERRGERKRKIHGGKMYRKRVGRQRKTKQKGKLQGD